MVTNEPRSPEPAPDPETAIADVGGRERRLVPPDVAELAPLRTWVDRQLAAHVEAPARDLFLVALTEAATNAIEAHQRHALDRPIVVTVDIGNARVVVEDEGGGVDAVTVTERPAPAPSAHRGRGVLIIRSICPEAHFGENDAGGARVVLPLPA